MQFATMVSLKIMKVLCFIMHLLDKSVLENHHSSTAFQIISQDEFNIFKNFNREQYTKVRERIIGMVLATDMAHHFTDIGKLKARLCAGFFY